jgi:hypothetical protein
MSLKNVTDFNSFIVMLGMDDLGSMNIDFMFHLNSMTRFCGNFETTYSTAYAMSRLECRFTTAKFKPLKILWEHVSKDYGKNFLRIRIYEYE